MNSFKKRQDEFEKKFSHDEELRFKVHSRCAKLFGLWVAEKLGKENEDAENYAREMISLSMQKGGTDALKAKAKSDLEEKGETLSDHQLDVTLSEKLEEAQRQLTT